MKTIFKVGMEVWDKTISPNKGRVIEVFADAKFDFPIKVEFENDIRARYTNKDVLSIVKEYYPHCPRQIIL